MRSTIGCCNRRDINTHPVAGELLFRQPSPTENDVNAYEISDIQEEETEV